MFAVMVKRKYIFILILIFYESEHIKIFQFLGLKTI